MRGLGSARPVFPEVVCEAMQSRVETESKSAQTRARIVDAAAYILSRSGYAAFRLADVARQAEVRTPAIYYYFQSRDELIAEVLRVGIAQTRGHVCSTLAELPSEAHPMDRLIAAVHAHLVYLLDLSDYATAFIRNARQVPAEVRRNAIHEEELYGHLWQDLFGCVAESLEPELREELRVTQLLILGALNWTAEWRNVGTLAVGETISAAMIFVRKALSGYATDGTAAP